MSNIRPETTANSIWIPQEWIERRLEQTTPQLSRSALADLERQREQSGPHEAELPCAIMISYVPQSMTRWTGEFGMSVTELLGALEMDILQGVAVEETHQKSRDGGTMVRLFGARWRVVVRPQLSQNSRQMMAVLHGVELRDIPSGKTRFAPASVSFHPIWDEIPCQPESWVQAYQAVRDEYVETLSRSRKLTDRINSVYEQRKDGVAKSLRELRQRKTDEAVRNRDSIHKAVRRQYSALRVMMDLLRLRSEQETHTFDANVLAAETVGSSHQDDGVDDMEKSDLLRIELSTPAPTGVLDEGTLVELHMNAGTRPKRAKIRSVADVNGSSCVDVDLASDTFPAGSAIQVQTISRFGMWAHQRAVQDLLKERIEGRWPDLANLLCSPDRLALTEPTPCERFFCDDDDSRPSLNEQQRAAVIGALASPHAFCIQGPPGTGKTTVICELVQQMIAKGERVLLVAPTHVAVDEVLRRIGSREGVRALRLAWDDSRVSEDVRKFTPANIIDPFLERARNLDAARSNRWQDERAAIADASKRLRHLRSLQQAHADVREQKLQSDSLRNETQQALESEQPDLRLRLDSIQTAIDVADNKIDSLKNDARSAELRLKETKSTAGWIGTVAGWVLLGEVGKSKLELRRTNKTIRATEGQREALNKEQKVAQTRLDTLKTNARSAKEAAARMAGELEAAADNAEKAEKACRENRLLSRHALDADTLKQLLNNLRDRDERLTAYQELFGRFDTLIGEATEENEDLDGLRRDLLGVTNLFCCTTTGIAGSPELRDLVFDTLIIDEASRVTDSEFLIGAVRAKRWVLVGDEHQLPPYVEQNDEHFIHALSALYQSELTENSLEDAVEDLGKLWEEDEELHRFRRDSVLSFANRMVEAGDWERTYRDAYVEGIEYLKAEVDDPSRALLNAMRDNLVRSLFERVVMNCSPALKVRLIEQRRMIEPIALIVSDPVYDGDYRTPPAEDLAKCGITPLITPTFPTPVTFLDTSMLGIRARDKLVRNSFVNETEARWVVEACRTLERELTQAGSQCVSVSILTFYKAQARLISDQLFGKRHGGSSRRFSCLRFSVIDSIDKIQGQESDIVFLSFCRTAGKHVSPRFGQWLQDLRRLNVACTRAHRALIFVGQRELLGRLCSNDPAMQFYRHLDDLFDERKDDMRVVRQFGGSRQ
ncbi:MAG: AAA family ATPase [Planctomycetales bacterium]|nr:AAA family ATPase [Planctomycetales bacterium]